MGTDIVLNSGQVTPRGYDWPLCESVTSYLVFGSAEVPVEYYPNSIVLEVAAGVGYVDFLPQTYQPLGASGMITMCGTERDYPGSSIGKMVNNDNFGFTSNNSWAWVDITIVDFGVLFDYYNQTTILGGIPTIITITCEKDDNMWKMMPLFWTSMVMKVLNGLACVFFLVWISRMFYMILEAGIRKESTDRLIVLCSLFIGCVFRIIGLIDFGAYTQVLPYILATLLTSAGVPFIFAAAWYMNLVTSRSLEDDGIAVNNGMDKYRYIFILIGVFLIALEWVCAPVVGLPFPNDPYAPLRISYAWVGLTVAFSGALAIFHFVTSSRTIHFLKRGDIELGKSRARQAFTRRIVFMCIALGVCFVGYSISAGITFLFISNPWALTGTWLFYTTDLSVITYLICRVLYQNLLRKISGTPDGTEQSKNSTDLTSTGRDRTSTLTTGIESPRQVV